MKPIKARRNDWSNVNIKTPYVTCSPMVYAKAQSAVYGAPEGKEIGMLISCEMSDDGVIEVQEIYIPHQTVSGGDVDFNPDHVAECEEYALNDNRVINGWWHSHGHFACRWSPTDIETMDKMRQCFGCGYVVSIVSNQKDEVRCRVDVRYSSPMGEVYKEFDGIPFTIKYPKYTDARNEIYDLIDQRVTTRESAYQNKNFAAVSHGRDNMFREYESRSTAHAKSLDEYFTKQERIDDSVEACALKCDESVKALKSMRAELIDEYGIVAAQMSWDSVVFQHSKVYQYQLDAAVLARLDFSSICNDIIEYNLEDKLTADIDDEQFEALVSIARTELDALGITVEMMDDDTVVRTWRHHIEG